MRKSDIVLCYCFIVVSDAAFNYALFIFLDSKYFSDENVTEVKVKLFTFQQHAFSSSWVFNVILTILYT